MSANVFEVMIPCSVWGDHRNGYIVHRWDDIHGFISNVEINDSDATDEEILGICAKEGMIKSPNPNQYIVKREKVKTLQNTIEPDITIFEKKDMYPVGRLMCLGSKS